MESLMVTAHASIGAGERDRRGEAEYARAGVRRRKEKDGSMVALGDSR